MRLCTWCGKCTLDWVLGLIICTLTLWHCTFIIYTSLQLSQEFFGDQILPCCCLLIMMDVVTSLTDEWQEGAATGLCQALGLCHCSIFVILGVSAFIQPNKRWRMRGWLPSAAPGAALRQCPSVPHSAWATKPKANRSVLPVTHTHTHTHTHTKKTCSCTCTHRNMYSHLPSYDIYTLSHNALALLFRGCCSFY